MDIFVFTYTVKVGQGRLLLGATIIRYVHRRHTFNLPAISANSEPLPLLYAE